MGKRETFLKRVMTWALCICMAAVLIPVGEPTAKTTAPAVTITYKFQGNDAATAGFAQGTITVKSKTGGNYYLYWANDTKALSGYYEIARLNVKKGKSSSFTFAEQIAIPADATKIIAVKSTKEPADKTVKKAAAVYKIPAKKQIKSASKDALYTFNSYSDIHIDEEKWGGPAAYWQFSEKNWEQALEYSVKKNVDFIVSSGDQVTNANFDNLDKEWKAYQSILAQSDYVNPIYEAGGNHEVRKDPVPEELAAYVKGSGLDSNISTIESGKSYYTMTEPKTGDLFIFMSLEGGYRPAQYDEFTDEQLDWLENTLKENYNQGKNIYLIQHALISGYGAGDDTENPYYGGSINKDLPSAKRFISIIEQYPDIIWISGHTHEDYRLGYNYSNNNGTSCNMIHNSSVGNPTTLKTEDGKTSLSYDFHEDNSQGYYVQVFKDVILFNGANLHDQKIYPAYSYIIKGNTAKVNEIKDNYTVVDKEDLTSGSVNSMLATVKTYLSVNYQYSSYDQYQQLKKTYYQYKSADTSKMSAEQLKTVYSKLNSYLEELHKVVTAVAMN
ncbi:MAG: metallophosphoesterase [Lachnospiraceae bacterium]|nr:metallophosphoesterase [Agathobacter sp.]MDD6444890.1 metallophosphoesterase [Lachnospiraceae bacterium]MDY4893109.1 metallophosphoesterase [Agathobacter sp.]